MVIHSDLSKKAYLSAMRSQMEGHFDFGSERFTGFFLGNCFYVTHHAGYEWNRRYTNQKNAAMGFVKKAEDGCTVHFIRFRGMLCPAQFLFVLLLFIPLMTFSMLMHGIMEAKAIMLILGICIAAVAITAPISALIESMTERSEEGRRSLLSLLLDPSDPFENYNKIP